MSDQIATLQAALESAKANFLAASAAYGADSTEENLNALRAAGSAKNAAQAALTAAQQAATPVSEATITLMSAGKQNRTVIVTPGSTLLGAVIAAGWSTSGVSFSLINGSEFSALPGSWIVPAGQHNVMVQPEVRGGC